LASAGELNYYFWKTLYMPVLLLAVFAAAIVGIAVSVRTERFALPGLLAVAAWLLTTSAAGPFVSGTIGKPPVQNEVVAAAVASYPGGSPDETDIIVSRCDADEAAYTSWWLGGILLDWTVARDLLHDSRDYSLQAARAYATEHPATKVVALTEPNCAQAESSSGDISNLELRQS
jgi:hypothetical protein